MPKQKTLFIRRSDIIRCGNCGTLKRYTEIYTGSSYHKKSLKVDFSFCLECLKTDIGLTVKNILRNSPLIFFTYEKNPILPFFLKRVNDNENSNNIIRNTNS